MGGRGAGSSIAKMGRMVEITKEDLRFRMQEVNGKAYILHGDIPEEVPGKLDDLINNARKNGGSVRIISKMEQKREEKRRQQERTKSDAFLNQEDASGGGRLGRRFAREAKIRDRALKRR